MQNKEGLKPCPFCGSNEVKLYVCPNMEIDCNEYPANNCDECWPRLYEEGDF